MGDPTHSTEGALAKALTEAQRTARAVGLDARNEFHKYRFASAEAMIEEGRSSLSLCGLSLHQASVDLVVLDRDLEQGKERSRVIVRIGYVLAHESGETREFVRSWPAVESNGRPIDKAVGGACTAALKYAIRDLLLLPRDDEQADMDRRDERAADKSDEPARTEDRERGAEVAQRDSKPANDQNGAAEHAFVRLLPLIQSRALKPDLLAGEIDKATELNEEERKALDFVVQAFAAKNKARIAAIGSGIRSGITHEGLREWTLKAMRPAWDQLHAEPAKAAS